MIKRFTGFHMFGILVAFFGTVMAVNFTMAGLASSTFGGIVVENSYVASQKFNTWLDQAEAQRQLGWEAATTWRPDGKLVIAVAGAPSGLDVSATVRHPVGRQPDRAFDFEWIGQDRYVSEEALPAGRWILRLAMSDGRHEWRREEDLR